MLSHENGRFQLSLPDDNTVKQADPLLGVMSKSGKHNDRGDQSGDSCRNSDFDSGKFETRFTRNAQILNPQAVRVALPILLERSRQIVMVSPRWLPVDLLRSSAVI